jgi:maleylpyruvate isomerase
MKGLKYEYVPVHLVNGEQNQDAYTALNPQHQVPTLQVRDLATGKVVTLTQSLPIIEFLDEAFPQSKAVLLPKGGPDALMKRAQARRVAEMVNSGIQPLQNLSVMNQITAESGGAYEGKAFGRDAIVKGLGALEAVVKEVAGKYCVGDTVTLADAALIPQLYNARRFDVDLAPYPTLLRVEAALVELEPFKKAHPDQQIDAVRQR